MDKKSTFWTIVKAMFEEILYNRKSEAMSQSERVSLFLRTVDALPGLSRICLTGGLMRDGFYIGVAAGWSRSDIRLLDLILKAKPDCELIVFDFTEITRANCKLLSVGGDVPLQTPIFGKREYGKWSFIQQGFCARKLLLDDWVDTSS